MDNPCYYCQHYGADMDWHTGIEDVWCDAEDEFAICEQKPCPYFKPRLPSDDLFEQLANEEEARFQEECDKEYAKWQRENDEDL